MKFADLKQSLKQKIEPVYLITGSDLYLKSHALHLIEASTVPVMPDLNMVRFVSDTTDFSDVVAACGTMPMMDKFRLVVVKDFEPKKTENNKKLISTYIKKPNPFACLILVSEAEGDFYSAFDKDVCIVDCGKLDLALLKKVVVSMLTKQRVTAEASALTRLLEYTNFNLARIEGEVLKLSSLVGEGGVINADLVAENVNKDIEYVAYELSDALAVRNNERAYEILGLMLADKETPQSILILVLSAFRRMFYACTQSATEAEIARGLGVKDYAVKMAKRSGERFTKMQLKNILELGGELDFKIRRGEIGDEVALNSFVFGILGS